MNQPTTVLDTAMRARELFHRNADTLIAGFLIQHPDVDPADVELVFTPLTNGTMRFSIEPKELHVPPALRDNDPGTSDEGATYHDGWNDCRQAMIDKTAAARAPEAMVSTLEAADVRA